MQKSRIEWTDYSLNPIKGLCPVDCKDAQGKPYCYARRMYKRFKWNPEIRFEDVFNLSQNPARFFVGSTMELFGDWIKPEWMQSIFADVRYYPQHTFIFLTKQPQNLIKWSPFPENCWVGVTATDTYMAVKGLQCLDKIQAKVKFISFEPLLSQTCMTTSSLSDIDWLVIGQQTPISAKTQPKIEYIQEIVEAADKAGIPVFLKNNLQTLFDSEHKDGGGKRFGKFELRQEFPKC